MADHTLPRIAMLVDRYAPLWGGTENQLRQLLPHLHGQGCQVFVVTRRWDSGHPEFERIDRTEVTRVGLPGRSPLNTLSYILGIGMFLFRNRHRFDILQTNGAAALAVLGALYGLLLGKTCVARIGSTGRVTEFAEGRLSSLAMPLFRRVSGFISLSAGITAELCKQRIPSQRIHAISNGVDCARFQRFSDDVRLNWRRSRNLSENAILVLFASLFKPGKGHELLLQAWSEIEKQEDTAWLLLLGSANFQTAGTTESIETQVRQLRLQRVIFLGETLDTSAYTGIADICAFPSQSEGCPNTLLEAMASELAPVVFDVDGVRDVADHGKTALLAQYHDLHAFTANLLNLIRDPERRRQLADNARMYVSTRHSFPFLAQRYSDLYRQLFEGAKK